MVIKSNNTEWIQEKIREGLDIGKGQIELEIVNHAKPNKTEEFKRVKISYFP